LQDKVINDRTIWYEHILIKKDRITKKNMKLNDKCPRRRLKYRLKQQVRKYVMQNDGRV
jgi:hypothetical protein